MEREAVLSFLRNRKPLLWINPERRPTDSILPGLPLQNEDILDAESRLARFAPLLAKLFPELEKRAGVIESELQALAAMASWMKRKAAGRLKGKILIKADYELPVAGSVKARGGIYEVLLFAENLALEQNRLAPGEDLLKLSQPDARDLFRRYTVSVGSTGNLGLSIGMTAAALGFKAVVHMSREAKQWKKERLRGQGVEVVEYAADYSAAVAAGPQAVHEPEREVLCSMHPLGLGSHRRDGSHGHE